MFMDYITYQCVTQDAAEQMMLQDLERLFRKSRSSLEKFGFPTPDNVPTELEEAISLWIQPDVMARQKAAVDSLNAAIKKFNWKANNLLGGNSKPGIGISC